MRYVKEEHSSSSNAHQDMDLVSAVKRLHGLNSQELTKLIRESGNSSIQYFSEAGLSTMIDLDKLARYLPSHLMAKLMLSKRDDKLFRYLLCGLRLLHSLCDLAPRHPKLEQILLDDLKISDQIIDLVFYLLVVLGRYNQGNHASSSMPLLHSALVACSLHLLTVCIASQWQDLASILVSHCKVDMFMDAVLAALRVDIKFLLVMLSAHSTDFFIKSNSAAEGTLNYLCQQCEASLQFLHSLCGQKSFRERLAKNKELCREGGFLLLAQSILNLKIKPSSREPSSVVAAVSRLKSKVLSILLHLCESDSISYLDEVASCSRSMDLAKTVAFEVLELLKNFVDRDPRQPSSCSDKTYPMGLLLLNALRLADILSDDSNFQSYITVYFTEVLTAIFSLPHQEFLSNWCSSELSVREEDATLEFDSFAAAGSVVDLTSLLDSLNMASVGSTFAPNSIPGSSYAHQRASLLVKVIANLHCYVPGICQEKEDVFLNKFLECLRRELPKLPISESEKAGIVTKNLRSLLSHAESLVPSFLNQEDVHLLRMFLLRIESLKTPAGQEANGTQEAQSIGGGSEALLHEVGMGFNYRNNLEALPGNSAPMKGGELASLGEMEMGGLNCRSGDVEGMSENSAPLKDEQLPSRRYTVGQSGDLTPQANREDKDELHVIVAAAAASSRGNHNKDVQNAETSGSDSSSTRGKDPTDQISNNDHANSRVHNKDTRSEVPDDERTEIVNKPPEKHQRKRKRTIMNDKQIALIENALLDEPNMLRNASLIQSWADELRLHGPEVTTAQLKNWLNNRKARLARAAKDVHTPQEANNNIASHDKQTGSGVIPQYDSSDSPTDDVSIAFAGRGNNQGGSTVGEMPVMKKSKFETAARSEVSNVGPAALLANSELGQFVLLVDEGGEEIGRGKVYQVQGKWCGQTLDESDMCVVDVIELLKGDKNKRLPFPCEVTGNSFEEAEKKLGMIRVLWDSNKLFIISQ
ncbi:nodulin homeobox [Impatiens glandulifera]|uniref:nodulin homeobox n=1 Tax=Impatiens glandulifera TaxID=253017 RepID=UPI001FB11F38|nr:nodulin homeobox [Impatiens glandulifera]